MTFGLRRQVSDALVAHGFRRGRHGYHTRTVNDDFCVVVDTGPTSATADAVDLVVGLHSHQVERLEAELLELPIAKEDFITAGSSLGHWCGPSLVGIGMPTSSLLGNADDVVQAVEREAARLGDFARGDLLYALKSSPFHYVRKLSIAILQRDQQVVEEVLADAERSECQEHVQLCNQYRRVASNARRMGSETEGLADPNRVTLRDAD